jgi:hypothetical protein
MRNSEPRDGHSGSVSAVAPALEPVVSRRGLTVMLGGPVLPGPHSLVWRSIEPGRLE